MVNTVEIAEKRKHTPSRMRTRINQTFRLSREAALFIKIVAAHDKKTQGQLLEEWITAAYAWRLLGDHFTKRPRAVRALLKSMLEWEHRTVAPVISPLLWPREKARPYDKAHFYFRLLWERIRYRLALAVIRADYAFIALCQRVMAFRLHKPSGFPRIPHIKISISITR